MGQGNHEGGCLCRAVRYRVRGDPLRIVNCHCTQCRRASGAPYVTWAVFRDDKWDVIHGEPRRYESSARAVRTFCGRCGSSLTFRHHGRPQEIDVTTATFDEPERLPPTKHIFTASRIKWVQIDDGLPVHEGFADAIED